MDGGENRLLHVVRQHRGPPLDHVNNVIVFDFDVMQGAHPANDVVGHGDYAHLQASADLHIRPRGTEEEHVGGKASDVDDEGSGAFLQLPGLGHHSGVGLGIDQHLPDDQGDGLSVEGELDAAPLSDGS